MDLPRWLAEELPFRHRMIDGLHVMEAGPPTGQPVLCLHGNPTWGFLYRKVARALEGSGLRVVMPDLAGMGLSDPVKVSEHSLAAHARRIGALIDTLGLEKIVFVGQDWGGPIGFAALAPRRARVAGLVILNTVIGPPRPGFRPTLFHRSARWPIFSSLLFRGLHFPQVALFAVQGDRSSIRGKVARAYRWPLRGWRRNVGPLALTRMVPDSQTHPSVAGLEMCQDFVTSFDGPVEVVWGDRDPILGRVRGYVEKMLPRARVTRTQAGHFLQEEVPDEIAAAIRRVAGK